MRGRSLCARFDLFTFQFVCCRSLCTSTAVPEVMKIQIAFYDRRRLRRDAEFAEKRSLEIERRNVCMRGGGEVYIRVYYI